MARSSLLVKLRPAGPVRLGSETGNRHHVGRVLHSDSLYSALTHAMAQLGRLEEWLSATAVSEGEPALRISSGFPFKSNQLFVPPPRSVWPLPPSLKVRWKAARFITASAAASLLSNGTLIEEQWTVDAMSECLMPSGMQGGPFRESLRSSAAVDRMGAGAFAYQTACLEFAPDSGLWFAVEFASEESSKAWRLAVEGAIRLLADSGVGGERSRGWGHFSQLEIREGELAPLVFGTSWTAPAESNAQWLLSMFSPSSGDQVDWSQGAYAVVDRGGRVESQAGWGAEKRLARMVCEGSVLVSTTRLIGSARNVAPDGFAHPVYRAGFALSIPIAWKAV